MSMALAPTHFKMVDALIYWSCLVGSYDKIKTITDNLVASGQCVAEAVPESGNYQQIRMIGSSTPVFIFDHTLKQVYICNIYITEELEDINVE